MNKIVCVILLFFIFDCNCHVIEDEHPERVLPAPPECGLPSSLAKRSVGGGPTVVSNFPWTVFLIYDNDPEPESVLLGTTDIRNCTKIVDVAKTLIHPKYEKVSDSIFEVLFDIGLIQMAESVEFSQEIYPICLPFQIGNYEPPNVNTTFLVSGWGTTKYIDYNYFLTAVQLKYFEFEKCFEIFSTQDITLSNKVFCAGGKIGVDTCFRDSGSPVVREIGDTWILEGIVSSGLDSTCGTMNPALYTNVIKYEDWIRDEILNDLENGQSGIYFSLTLIVFCYIIRKLFD
uniref:Peptidase S1 domain-containing protein n=1 Tax=Megaselia scalaris TaxID=36166 RepID=T1GM36_MEGSC